ncbi:hypothetical protein NDU88_004884 [Pleurodeles waltl]|uniref:Uncharacterized protein n=1 Tax=Pleurodeles waltl TaxID=8319 RepID=A0AAV7WA96_PLEWA|nr:hypothetical protein NDU88_004884 [Pleurodeles waltl]
MVSLPVQPLPHKSSVDPSDLIKHGSGRPPPPGPFHLGSPPISGRIHCALDPKGEHSRAPFEPPEGSRNHTERSRLHFECIRLHHGASRAFSCFAPRAGVSVALPHPGLGCMAPSHAIRPFSHGTHTGHSRSPRTSKFFFPDG